MSYRSGLGPQLAATMGVEPGGPRITCDGCGLVRRIPDDRLPPAWFLDNRAAPGWKLVRTEDGDGGVTRQDLCPRCKVAK